MKNNRGQFHSSWQQSKRMIKKEKMISSKGAKTDLLDTRYRHFDFDPVDVISGAYSYQHTDFETKGQVPLCWCWSWESINNNVGSLGNRISFIYDEHLEIDAEEGIIYHIAGDGRQTEFPWLLGDQVYHDLAQRMHLMADNDTYILTDYKLKQERTFIQSKINGDYYHLKEIKNFLGFKLELFYNETEQLQTIMDSNQQIFSVQFNDQGFIQSLLYKAKKIAEYTYSAEGNLLRVSDIEGEKIDFTYNENHLLTERKDKNGLKFHWRYDQFGRVTHTWGDGHIKEGWIEYHESRGYNLVTDYYGGQTKYYYNKLGLVKKILLSTGGCKRYYYNEKNWIVRELLTDGKIISYSYNELGWLIEKKSSEGWTEKYSYDKNGSLKDSEDRNDQLIEYNQYGQIAIERLDDCKKIMTYNSFGYISELFREKGTAKDIFSYKYDEKNRLITINKNNNLIRMYKYDEMNQIIGINAESGKVIELDYDKTGKVSIINSGNVTYKFSYDFNGRFLKAVKGNQSILKIKRNKSGQIIEEVWKDTPIRKFEYNYQERVKKITFSNNDWLAPKYDKKGNINKIIYSDETWEAYDYDDFDNITEASNLSSITKFNYNHQGRITSETTSLEDFKLIKFPVSYEYAENNQLKSVKLGNQIKEVYTENLLGKKIDVFLLEEREFSIQKSGSAADWNQFTLLNAKGECITDVEVGDTPIVKQKKKMNWPIFYGSGLLSITHDEERQPLIFQYDCFGRLIEIYTKDNYYIFAWAQDKMIFEIVTYRNGHREMNHLVSHFDSNIVNVKRNFSEKTIFIEDSLNDRTQLIKNNQVMVSNVKKDTRMIRSNEIDLSDFGVNYSYQQNYKEEQNQFSNTSISNTNAMLSHFLSIRISEHLTDESVMSSVVNQEFLKNQSIFLTMLSKRFFLKNLKRESYGTQLERLEISIVPVQKLEGLQTFGILQTEDLLEENINNRINNFFRQESLHPNQ